MFLIQPFALAVYLEARACMGFSVSRVFRRHPLLFYLRRFFCLAGGPFLRPGLHPRRAGAERRSTSAVGRRRRRREAILTAASAAQRLIRLGSPYCLLIFVFPRLAQSPCTTQPFATNRGEPACARNSRRNLYPVGPVRGPDHEAVIRFGGVAPRRRAHSNERFNDHVPARVTTTSDRWRQPPHRVPKPELRFLAGLVDSLPQPTPCGTSPVVTMRQSTMSNLRARATIIFVLRAPFTPSVRLRNHCARALSSETGGNATRAGLGRGVPGHCPIWRGLSPAA